jgi:DNA-binding response OmpR family regulator
MPARILVVEDDAVVAETLEAYLQQAGYEVVLVRDGRQALALAQDGAYALIILDLMIPGLPGLDVCREVRRISRMPVLMLTARTAEQDRVRGFEAGADDYVPKPFSPREVVCRVQALLRRTAGAPDARPEPWSHGDLSIDRWSREVSVRGQRVATTRTEFGILDALVLGDGRTLTRDELLSRVFGPDYEGSDRTIDTHVTNLRRKLDSANPQRFVVTVHGLGYRWGGRDDA